MGLGYRTMSLWFEVPLDYHRHHQQRHNQISAPSPSEEPPWRAKTLTLHAELVYGYKIWRDRRHHPEEHQHHSPCNAAIRDRLQEVLTPAQPDDQPPKVLLYLCGGPGDGNKPHRIPGLNKFALDRGYVVLYVDYRGTGHSVMPTTTTMDGMSPEEKATYLSLFRQDNIVRDLEAIRLCLADVMGGANNSNDSLDCWDHAQDRSRPGHHQHDHEPHVNRQRYHQSHSPDSTTNPQLKLTLLGQSFGGWIALTYISFLPASISAVFLAAGLAPFTRSPKQVYSALFRRVVAINEAYYQMYPEDVGQVQLIVQHLRETGGYILPPEENNEPPHIVGGNAGGHRLLTAQTFMTIGRLFGGSGGSRSRFEHVHGMVSRMVGDLTSSKGGRLSAPTVAAFASSNMESFRLHQRPLYAVLHEAIYCHSPGMASGWAALEVARGVEGFGWLSGHSSDNSSSHSLDEDQGQNYGRKQSQSGDSSDDDSKRHNEMGEKLYFSGEMIYPFMLSASGSPLCEPEMRAAAEVLTQKKDWPALYDRAQLARNFVPVRALAYKRDMYVDFGLSVEAGAAIGNCVVLESDEWGHSALKEGDKTGEVLGMLFGGSSSGEFGPGEGDGNDIVGGGGGGAGGEESFGISEGSSVVGDGEGESTNSSSSGTGGSSLDGEGSSAATSLAASVLGSGSEIGEEGVKRELDVGEDGSGMVVDRLGLDGRQEGFCDGYGGTLVERDAEGAEGWSWLPIKSI
ncbi:Alpha/Beta hydrolase protein [Bombardia bombarda]|uniref:Alpha/Beta hydrolase protein n=1 Tax=Bombardia bombarda TaxID=252184 RepID=A0AA39WH13_9PEZI|nr:Alpha/Beta hydrolase protein [Bombardia bombarda]